MTKKIVTPTQVAAGTDLDLVPQEPAQAAAPAPAKAVYVRAIGGELLHLYTNIRFTTDPKKVVVDEFLKAQIDAGKAEIVTD